MKIFFVKNLIKKNSLEQNLDEEKRMEIPWLKRSAVEINESKPGMNKLNCLLSCSLNKHISQLIFTSAAIQNDLIHGWGLDFAVRKCVQNAHEKIGVVDAQWIIHQGVPSLGNQGLPEEGKQPWEGVRERCRREWTMFQDRLDNAEKSYFEASAHNNASSSRPHK